MNPQKDYFYSYLWFNYESMSVQLKENKKENYYSKEVENHNFNRKVNLNELLARMAKQQKQEKKNNIILSAAAISVVTVFGIILTL